MPYMECNIQYIYGQCVRLVLFGARGACCCTIGAVLARHPRTVRVYVRLPARPRASRGVIVRGGGRGACLHSGKRGAGLCDLITPIAIMCERRSAKRG